MFHLTLTGPLAGTPFCGVDKATARERGETFMHVPYTNANAVLARPDLCPACAKAWEDAR